MLNNSRIDSKIEKENNDSSLRSEEIKKQAKKILDNFASALENIKTEDVFVERQEDRREEKEPDKPNEDFRKRMLENAPDVKDDCIVAEKGGWV